jgi:hypothetical protein
MAEYDEELVRVLARHRLSECTIVDLMVFAERAMEAVIKQTMSAESVAEELKDNDVDVSGHLQVMHAEHGGHQ